MIEEDNGEYLEKYETEELYGTYEERETEEQCETYDEYGTYKIKKISENKKTGYTHYETEDGRTFRLSSDLILIPNLKRNLMVAEDRGYQSVYRLYERTRKGKKEYFAKRVSCETAKEIEILDFFIIMYPYGMDKADCNYVDSTSKKYTPYFDNDENIEKDIVNLTIDDCYKIIDEDTIYLNGYLYEGGLEDPKKAHIKRIDNTTYILYEEDIDTTIRLLIQDDNPEKIWKTTLDRDYVYTGFTEDNNILKAYDRKYVRSYIDDEPLNLDGLYKIDNSNYLGELIYTDECGRVHNLNIANAICVSAFRNHGAIVVFDNPEDENNCLVFKIDGWLNYRLCNFYMPKKEAIELRNYPTKEKMLVCKKRKVFRKEIYTWGECDYKGNIIVPINKLSIGAAGYARNMFDYDKYSKKNKDEHFATLPAEEEIIDKKNEPIYKLERKISEYLSKTNIPRLIDRFESMQKEYRTNLDELIKTEIEDRTQKVHNNNPTLVLSIANREGLRLDYMSKLNTFIKEIEYNNYLLGIMGVLGDANTLINEGIKVNDDPVLESIEGLLKLYSKLDEEVRKSHLEKLNDLIKEEKDYIEAFLRDISDKEICLYDSREAWNEHIGGKLEILIIKFKEAFDLQQINESINHYKEMYRMLNENKYRSVAKYIDAINEIVKNVKETSKDEKILEEIKMFENVQVDLDKTPKENVEYVLRMLVLASKVEYKSNFINEPEDKYNPNKVSILTRNNQE